MTVWAQDDDAPAFRRRVLTPQGANSHSLWSSRFTSRQPVYVSVNVRSTML